MKLLLTTERDYEKATRQSVGKRGKRTTSGAKFLNAERFNTNDTKTK
tara:strand:+ start:833 stop:973 length:141 start_codon:yes stop_codon:yes gene_type:complete